MMKPVLSQPIRIADLPQGKPTPFRLVPDAGELERLADRMGVDELRKVKLEVQIAPGPGRDWSLSGHLGATVVQPCRVTTDPVTTRIEEDVTRRYAADYVEPEDDELEMDADETVEALPTLIDPGALLEETLALAIPPFPRSEAAEELDLSAAPPGAAPLDAETVKPFAGLAALKAQMEGKSDED